MTTTSSPWPDGMTGAVSLSFDDGSPDQLDIAVPVLNEFGLLGTFYINPNGDDWRSRMDPWVTVAAAGHELGNHTLSHICSAGLIGCRSGALDTVTVEDIEADVLEAQRRLQALAGGQLARTFCYPCYESHVGTGADRQSYVPMIAKHFPAARAVGEAFNDPLLVDLHHLNARTVAGWMPGPELCTLVDAAVAQGRWIVLAFHEFRRGPRLERNLASYFHAPPMAEDDFRALCEHLASRRDSVWTDTVLAVATAVAAWRQRREDSHNG